jgi:putative FmdB family regulatory protein
MPIFEFKCKNCDHVFEEFLFSSNTESATIVCPKCGSENADKLMSAFSSSGGSASLGAGAASCGSSGFG